MTKPNDSFLNIRDCLAQLPIRMSRQALVNHIRCGPEGTYQEWRRQIFLTQEQWAFHVSRIQSGSMRVHMRAAHPGTGKIRSAEECLARAKRALQEAKERSKSGARKARPGLPEDDLRSAQEATKRLRERAKSNTRSGGQDG